MEDRPLRIVLVTEAYWGVTNGVVMMVKQLAHELANRGHRITVVAPASSPSGKMKMNGITTQPVRGVALPGHHGYMVAIPNKAAALHLYNADVIHTHHPFVLGHWALRFGKPVVFTSHTNYLSYLHYVPVAGSFLACPLRYYLKWFCNQCASVITPAPDAGRRLLSYGVKDPPCVIPNGINADDFALGNGRAWRDRYGIPPSAPVLIYVGRLAPEKRVDFVLQAAAELRNTPYILLAGDGPQKKELEWLRDELGLGPFAHFVGQIDYAQLPDFYDAGTLFVTASETEVHPLVVLEAQAAGLPAVVVDASGTAEIVLHEQTGIVTENNLEAFRNGIEQLLDQPSLIEVYGAAAQYHVQQFSVTTTVDRHIDLYRSLVR